MDFICKHLGEDFGKFDVHLLQGTLLHLEKIARLLCLYSELALDL